MAFLTSQKTNTKLKSVPASINEKQGAKGTKATTFKLAKLHQLAGDRPCCYNMLMGFTWVRS